MNWSPEREIGVGVAAFFVGSESIWAHLVSPQKVYHKAGITIMSLSRGVEMKKDIFFESLSKY